MLASKRLHNFNNIKIGVSLIMSKLEDDLSKYAGEVFEKGDVKAGIKLISEISGIVMLGGAVFTALTVWLPGLNIAIPTGALIMGLKAAAKEYSNMDEEQRKQLRAVASLLNGGIHKIANFLK